MGYYLVLSCGESCGLFAHSIQAVSVAMEESKYPLPFSHPQYDVVYVVELSFAQAEVVLRYMADEDPLPNCAMPDELIATARTFYDGVEHSAEELAEIFAKWEANNPLPLPE
jgi:hypothetical protein